MAQLICVRTFVSPEQLPSMEINTFADLRKLLTLSQDEFSLMLKMSRSAYASFEVGRRDMPVQTLLQLVEFQQVLTMPVDLPPDIQAGADAARQMASEWSRLQQPVLENELRAARRKLAQMESDYASALHVLGFIEREKESPTQHLLPAFYYDAMRIRLKKRLEDSSPLNQFKEKLKIASIEAELTLVRDFNAATES